MVNLAERAEELSNYVHLQSEHGDVSPPADTVWCAATILHAVTAVGGSVYVDGTVIVIEFDLPDGRCVDAFVRNASDITMLSSPYEDGTTERKFASVTGAVQFVKSHFK